jgi:hypothetical protein
MSKPEKNTQQTVQASHLEIVDNICHRTMTQVKGHDDQARSQAAYIATNRLKAAAIPPWIIDMLIAFAIDLIKKWMDERAGAPGVAAKLANNPPVKS